MVIWKIITRIQDLCGNPTREKITGREGEFTFMVDDLSRDITTPIYNTRRVQQK